MATREAEDRGGWGGWCDRLVAGGRVDAVAVETISVEPERPALTAGAASDAAGGAAVDERALFDLASLSKPWSATLALWLDDRGELPLATRVGDLWTKASGPVAALTLEDLLRHRAGFVRWRPLYAACADPNEALDGLLRGDWLADPPVEGYSDLDFILWALAVERATGTTYGEWVRRLGDALGSAEIFETGETAAKHAVACRLSTQREVELAADAGLRIEALPPPSRGGVQDGNARFFGRAVGHAGLFASRAAMARLGREWLSPGAVLSEGAVAAALGGEGRFALGWFRASETAAGRRLSAHAVGHDGFTGGSIWLDPRAGRGVVMLAHRASLDVDLGPVRVELVERAGLS